MTPQTLTIGYVVVVIVITFFLRRQLPMSLLAEVSGAAIAVAILYLEAQNTYLVIMIGLAVVIGIVLAELFPKNRNPRPPSH